MPAEIFLLTLKIVKKAKNTFAFTHFCVWGIEVMVRHSFFSSVFICVLGYGRALKAALINKDCYPLLLSLFYFELELQVTDERCAAFSILASIDGKLRSDELAGQSGTAISWSASQLSVVLALWAGAKSCWQKNSASECCCCGLSLSVVYLNIHVNSITYLI